MSLRDPRDPVVSPKAVTLHHIAKWMNWYAKKVEYAVSKEQWMRNSVNNGDRSRKMPCCPGKRQKMRRLTEHSSRREPYTLQCMLCMFLLN